MKRSNNELHDKKRRELLQKLASLALPVFASVLMGSKSEMADSSEGLNNNSAAEPKLSSPNIINTSSSGLENSNSTPSQSTSCNASCYSGCTGCGAGCSNTCKYGCTGNCVGSCTGDCSGSCAGRCVGCSSCTGSCTGCTGTCTGCTGTCAGCSGTCRGTCYGNCYGVY